MEVITCSEVQYGGESDCPQQSSGRDLSYDNESNLDEHGQQVQLTEGRVDGILQRVERPQTEVQFGVHGTIDETKASEGHCNGASCVSQVEGQKLSDYGDDDTNEQNDYKETCLASENCHLIVDIENDLSNSNREGESSFLEPTWLEEDESVALWVKWRGKWQAGIRCARADWPLSTLKAKPTHDRKKYFVIFFPHTRNYSWADMLLVRSINEYPQPIAYKTHKIGLKMVKDLTVARRFIMQKLAVGMLNIVDQFHTEALIETARDVVVWKEFAMEASHCDGYSDLGRMLLKLQNMILKSYINSDWLQNSFNTWVQRCQNAHSAESIEMLKEELFDSIQWSEVHSLRDAPVQPTLGSEWKTWKQEVMKWFSTSHPITNGGDQQQESSEGTLPTSLQVSRKRPKLEVRRAEAHAFQVESRASNQSGTLEIDSEFFNNRDIGNDATLASEPCKEEDLKEIAVSTDSLGDAANKWNEIIVEPENGVGGQTKDVEMTPVDQVTTTKPLDSGNKNRQCIAYIESKGRQCVRWANDGDVYCCVHLSSRFIGNPARVEETLSNDTPMCEGTTVLGTRCKHRSLPGSSFCKKHGPKNDMKISNFSEIALKRNYEENISSLETPQCKDIVLVGDVGSPLQVDPVSVMESEAFHGGSNLIEKAEHLVKDCNSTEVLHCIGSCLRDNSIPCLESPKRHSLYCEKHLPSWLKRARNGKSRIISKEVFIELLRGCHAQERKVHLHQACELFYRLFKSILSLRNPVPKEVQFQWALSEASREFGVGELFVKLVYSEKERLRRLWGFTADEDAQISSSLREEPAQLPWVVDGSHDDEKTIKCKICLEEFLDDQALGNHWMDNHKKEAQWLFRGYACAICLDSFTNKKVLETHVQERHHVQFVEQCMLLQCIPCGSHFGNTDQLWLHVLSAHLVDFRLSKAAQQTLPPGDGSSPKLELCSSAAVENDSEKLSGSRRFICRFCGLKFDLLPDLGRHHQAAHMGPSLVSSRPAKKGVRYYAYRLKSGRLSRPRFKKSLAAASYRIRNRATDNIKKRIQASKSLGTGETSVLPQVTEAAGLGRLAESQCSAVAKILFSEIQKTKPRPNNFDILSVACSTCCKIGLKASLEVKFELLPEHLYLKAAKLCSEQNIYLNWHQDGFICPKGCKAFKDPYLLSPLKPLTNGIVGHSSEYSSEPVDDKWQVDECHYVIDSIDLGQTSLQNVVLCDDVSFGQESIPVACVADDSISDSDSILVGSSGGQNNRRMPWESFTYITKPMLDQSLALDSQSLQLGCACPYLTCCPETCDHVYLFDNDYDDAKDIYGKPMRGRFPYDDKGRIILEEGYLVYECNQMCSCPRTCPNRVLQNGVRVKLEVFKTEKKGWAVKAGEAVLRGTFICEYIGEVLDEHEANTRRKRYGKEGCSYLYEIDSHINDMSRLIEGQARYIIDATKYGNVSRFINHSCSPNLVTHQVLVESMDCQRAHIGLYANRDISLGEELTYDYRYALLPGEGYSCHCGASTCCGRLH
ncbi:putative retinoblastoma binding protein (RIZ) [Parasponia andersonii]|uniref:Putative retinoblastoma binding protein (RIZ) n=1 Tax=Parasponia andersonii TaxID=3476 RepID=A0A2P5BZ71_PARAD|nr:putative retinoblastoma binding protein (RIZ) [Parasponia andersonii]